MNPRFELRALDAAYGGARTQDALAGIDLDIARGKAIALLGENGSGKSTLLKVLAGVLAPKRGTLLFDGRPLRSLPRRDRALAIGYLPQSFEPFFPATALELVLLGRTPLLTRFGGPGSVDRAAAGRALEEMDAGALEKTDIHEMSGGERQRVYLARVLAGEAEVLLLDEPTANLDPRHRVRVVKTLRRRVDRGGGTVVFSTHEMDIASAVADDALLLRKGRLVASGPVGETLTVPLLEELFAVSARVTALPDGRPFVVLGAGGRER